jgi:hypothetical protein
MHALVRIPPGPIFSNFFFSLPMMLGKDVLHVYWVKGSTLVCLLMLHDQHFKPRFWTDDLSQAEYVATYGSIQQPLPLRILFSSLVKNRKSMLPIRASAMDDTYHIFSTVKYTVCCLD